MPVEHIAESPPPLALNLRESHLQRFPPFHVYELSFLPCRPRRSTSTSSPEICDSSHERTVVFSVDDRPISSVWKRRDSRIVNTRRIEKSKKSLFGAGALLNALASLFIVIVDDFTSARPLLPRCQSRCSATCRCHAYGSQDSRCYANLHAGNHNRTGTTDSRECHSSKACLKSSASKAPQSLPAHSIYAFLCHSFAASVFQGPSRPSLKLQLLVLWTTNAYSGAFVDSSLLLRVEGSTNANSLLFYLIRLDGFHRRGALNQAPFRLPPDALALIMLSVRYDRVLAQPCAELPCVLWNRLAPQTPRPLSPNRTYIIHCGFLVPQPNIHATFRGSTSLNLHPIANLFIFHSGRVRIPITPNRRLEHPSCSPSHSSWLIDTTTPLPLTPSHTSSVPSRLLADDFMKYRLAPPAPPRSLATYHCHCKSTPLEVLRSLPQPQAFGRCVFTGVHHMHDLHVCGLLPPSHKPIHLVPPLSSPQNPMRAAPPFPLLGYGSGFGRAFCFPCWERDEFPSKR
ncbi:hypothetical protein C8R45DRAFT_1207806 [Mycena sanguinolenta]|nr:hypothetical protein C8R45DRAFT_1207806 [Mycena sanguinolenta]